MSDNTDHRPVVRAEITIDVHLYGANITVDWWEEMAWDFDSPTLETRYIPVAHIEAHTAAVKAAAEAWAVAMGYRVEWEGGR